MYLVFLLTTIALATGQTCQDIGILNYQGGSIVEQNTTYIIPSYNITCDGVVTGWEFCYQIINVPSMTFYPSVWRWSENNSYTLVHASSVMSDIPQLGMSSICTKHFLPVDKQFSVYKNDSIGLYSTINTPVLTTNDSDDYLVYSVAGNQNIVDPIASGVSRQHFRVGIVATICE